MKKTAIATLIMMVYMSYIGIAKAESYLDSFIGDINFDGIVGISDATYLINTIIEKDDNKYNANALYKIISSDDAELPPGKTISVGDVDMSGTLTTKDVVQIIRSCAYATTLMGSKLGVPVVLEKTGDLLIDNNTATNNDQPQGFVLEYLESYAGTTATFNVNIVGFESGIAGTVVEIQLPDNVIDAEISSNQNININYQNITDDKRLIFLAAAPENIVLEGNTLATVTLNLSSPLAESTVIKMGRKSEIISIDDFNDDFVGGRLADGKISATDIRFPIKTIVVPPPYVDPESGIVPYGTIVNIHKNTYAIGYTINDTSRFSWSDVQIPLYEDTVLSVWSAVDFLKPGYKYDTQSLTYTYTIDKNTIPQHSPSPEPDMYPYMINQLTLETTSGEQLSGFPENTSFMVNVNFVKTKQRDNKDFIFVAVYDEHGALLSLDYVKAKFMENEEYDVGFYIPPQNKIIGEVKAFIWSEFNSEEPLSKTVSIS